MGRWKPGDVGINTSGERFLVTLSGECAWESLEHDPVSGVPSKADRPLVVIDPESHDDTQRLAECYLIANHSIAIGVNLAADRLQLALREFVKPPPPPKPSEPMGDGAVVEDRFGHRWVRIAGPEAEIDSKPWRRRGVSGRTWEHVSAVRVLTVGVDS